MFFESFKHRVDIEAQLHCLTALRVGVGRGGGDTTGSNLPILRTAWGGAVVPGASLKGVLRTTAEALLRGVAPPEQGADTKAWACDPLGAPCFEDRTPPEEEGLTAPERAKARRGRMEDALCWVCKTFGCAGLASHVVVRDARAVGTPIVERRDGVAVDRDLGRVSGQRKYDFEVVPAGTRFELRLSIDSAKRWQEGLVIVALEALHEGHTRLGGMSSRGLGRVELEGLRVRIVHGDRLLAGDHTPDEPAWTSYRDDAIDAWKKWLGSHLGAREGRA